MRGCEPRTNPSTHSPSTVAFGDTFSLWEKGEPRRGSRSSSRRAQADDAAEAGDQMAGLDLEAVEREIGETPHSARRRDGARRKRRALAASSSFDAAPGQRQPHRRHRLRAGLRLAHEEERGARVALEVLRVHREVATGASAARRRRPARSPHRRRTARRRASSVAKRGGSAGRRADSRASSALESDFFVHSCSSAASPRKMLATFCSHSVTRARGRGLPTAVRIRKEPACRPSRSSTTTAISSPPSP